MTAVRAVLLAGLALGLLSACSMLRLAYDNARPALRYAALDYFPLEDDQREALDEALARLHERHRAQELPRYAALLREARGRWQGGLRPSDLEWALAAVEQRYVALVDAGLGDAARLLAGLTPQQVGGFAERLREANARFAREQLQGSPEDQLQRRAALLIERVEGWYGTLSEAQRERIDALSRGLPHAPALRLAERERRQAELLGLLRGGLTTDQLRPRLRAWLVHWRLGRGPEYERFAHALRREGIAMALEVDSMMRPAQRERALARLEGTIADLVELAADGTATAGGGPPEAVCAGGWPAPCS